MIFKSVLSLALAMTLLAAPIDAAAGNAENCAMIEQSISLGKAVTNDTIVLAAVSATDQKISESKYPTKTAKRRLQSMFLKYCGEFSGYKSFQVETRGGVSGSVACNGKSSYAYAIKKSDITIKELTGVETKMFNDIPDIETKGDIFEEFK